MSSPMSTALIHLRDELGAFCRRHQIRRLRVFGSTARREDGPESDVDLLVEFRPGHAPGWEIVALEEELSGLLDGRRVDLVNPKYMNHRLRDRILAEAETLYDEG